MGERQATAEQRRRVLIVDDEVSIREVLGQYLGLEGFDVLAAADGVTALQLFQGTPPDLVILDLMLPGIDGIEVCRRMRAVSAAPIVMLTARSEEADKLEGFRGSASRGRDKRARAEPMRARSRPRGPGTGLVPPARAESSAAASMDRSDTTSRRSSSSSRAPSDAAHSASPSASATAIVSRTTHADGAS